MDKTLCTALVTLALAAVFGAGWWASAAAQVLPLPQLRSGDPTVLAGPDIGFRVERSVKGVPQGTLVVRVNGQWVEPSFSTAPRLLAQ